MSATRQNSPSTDSRPAKRVAHSYGKLLLEESRRLLGTSDGKALKGGNAGASFSLPCAKELDVAAKDLLGLQRGLTGERALIGSSYMEGKRWLSSYLLFYWPVSYAQTQAMLAMAGFTLRAQKMRILDLGSGPAPCSLAAADFLRAAYPRVQVDITACDRSELALGSAKQLAEASGYTMKTIPNWDAGTTNIPDGTFELIIMGHLINELWQDRQDRLDRRFAFMEKAFSRLVPTGALLVLEPALMGTGRDLLELRDRLAASGKRILAPCVRSGPCPALQAPGQTCHSDFAWTPPAMVRELGLRTGLDKELVKTTAFVMENRNGQTGMGQVTGLDSQNPIDKEKSTWRVVSDPMLNKAGRVRYLICGGPGRVPFSAKRGTGFPAERTFFSLRRSELIILEGAEERESGLGLSASTRIEKARPDTR